MHLSVRPLIGFVIYPKTCPALHLIFGTCYKKYAGEKKSNGRQNYLCKDCRRQFLKPGDYQQNGRRRGWLIYACHSDSGEIVAHVRGKRDTETADKLRRRLAGPGVRYGAIAADSWGIFGNGRHLKGRQYTKGIGGTAAA